MGNKTNNSEVANCTAPSLTAFDEKGRNDGCRALVDIPKASGGRPDLANWPNHGAEIDRACMQHAIRK